MMATPSALATTAADLLLVLLIVVPVAGVLLAFALGDRYVRRVAFTVIPVGLAISGGVLLALPQNDGHMVYLLGAWPPPLGVALRADGLSAVMLAATAIVVCAVAIFAAADFRLAAGYGRAPFAFWILLLAVWAALNTIFVGGDLFTLYVALELLTFAAVPLVSLEGQAETLQAALRYLLFALVGSVLYLMGTALLYGLYGTLDIVLLSHRVSTEPGALIAAALMTTGLLAKTALFPLHLWLPPAHAGAPAAASAILSGLVVKGSFFILLRVWFNVLPGVPGFAAAQFLAALGAGAIVVGSIVALRQERLKLLVAYSTMAQIGYLFLLFPLALDASGRLETGQALAGGLMQAISHAAAKAAMFLAVGSIYAGLGHDRITGIRGAARALPLSVMTFGLAGFALMGIQPSGASLAKELLLQETARTGQWWWAGVLQVGGIVHGRLCRSGTCPCAFAFGSAGRPRREAATRQRFGGACLGTLLAIAWPAAMGAVFADYVYRGIETVRRRSARQISRNRVRRCSACDPAQPLAASPGVFGSRENDHAADRPLAAHLYRTRQPRRNGRRHSSSMVDGQHIPPPGRVAARRADVRRQLNF
ncbi:multicomponent Na+:H+ antiporter subunit D [Bradyrhizobium sp. LM3.2]